MGEFVLNDSAFTDASVLFGNNTEEKVDETVNNSGKQVEEEKSNEEVKNTTEVVETAENLFGEDSKPKSVGGEENKKDIEEPSSQKEDVSPNNNFVSSFAKAMREDGYLQNLDEETLNGIKDAQSMAEAIEKEVTARLTEEQKRIKEALDYGIPQESIQNYTNIINNLNSIDEDRINAETDEGQNIRANLIYQDFINKGISEEKAKTLTKRSIDAGTDKEDAKDALESVKQFYQNKYDSTVNGAKEKEKEAQAKVKKEAEEFKKSLLESKEVFKGIQLDAPTRQKAYEVMTKIVGKDTDGNPVTKVQQYADEHPVEFRKALGVLFTLTNGFESLDGIINKQVKKQVKSRLSDFETKLSTSPMGGSLAYAEGDRGNGLNDVMKNDGWLLDNSKY